MLFVIDRAKEIAEKQEQEASEEDLAGKWVFKDDGSVDGGKEYLKFTEIPAGEAVDYLPDGWCKITADSKPSVTFESDTPGVLSGATAEFGVPEVVGLRGGGDTASFVEPNSHFVGAMNCGGFIRALDWCSVISKHRDALVGDRIVLAVSADKHNDTLHEMNQLYHGKSVIQIWSIRSNDNVLLSVISSPKYFVCVS